MRFTRQLILGLMCWLALTAVAQDNTSADDVLDWYIQQVVKEDFVQQYGFEYYYTPTSREMESMRRKGEVSYMLNTPAGFSVKKARETVDKVMESYEDISELGDWHEGDGNYWKDFRCDRNKFHFSVRRKAVDDGGVYYVSVTEIPNSFKSLAVDSDETEEDGLDEEQVDEGDDDSADDDSRRAITEDDFDAVSDDVPDINSDDDEQIETEEEEDDEQEPVTAMTEQERARAAYVSQKASEREEKALKHEQEKKAKAEEKARKEEEKKQKREQERLKKAEEAAAKRAQEEQSKKAAAAAASKYHYTDVALWLSENYGFTQVHNDWRGIVMFSTAINDPDKIKMVIKNALKGSTARMAMPWRLNEKNGTVETCYTVDGYVLVFAIGNDDEGHATLTIGEMSEEEFEQFKLGMPIV